MTNEQHPHDEPGPEQLEPTTEELVEATLQTLESNALSDLQRARELSSTHLDEDQWATVKHREAMAEGALKTVRTIREELTMAGFDGSIFDEFLDRDDSSNDN